MMSGRPAFQDWHQTSQKFIFAGMICLGMLPALGWSQQSGEPAQAMADWNMIEKEYKALRADRDNILAQVKVAYDERSKAYDDLKKVQDELVQSRTEAEALRTKLESADKEKFSIEEKATTYDAEIQDLKTQIEILRESNEKLMRENQELMDRPVTILEQSEKTPKSLMESVRDRDRLLRENADLHYNLGVLLTQSHEYKKAVIEFTRAIQLRPKDAASHFNLGKIYADYLNDRPKAVGYFEEYLRLNPEAEDRSWVEGFIATVKALGGKERDY